MQLEIKDLGCRTNIDVIKSLVSLDGLNVLDVGCGNLGFTRQIAELAERVLAIDPDAVQAEVNRNSSCAANIEFVETPAQSIPASAESIDGVFFAYSLHHIDATSYPDVFAEVFRVLKPAGFIYVIEPVDCPLNQVMRLFHDEEIERAAAQNWLLSIAHRFRSVEAAEYYGHTQYESFDDFARQFAGKSFNSLYTAADVRHPSVEAAFYQYAGPDLRFQSPRRVVFLQHFQNKNVRCHSDFGGN